MTYSSNTVLLGSSAQMESLHVDDSLRSFDKKAVLPSTLAYAKMILFLLSENISMLFRLSQHAGAELQICRQHCSSLLPRLLVVDH